MVVGCSRTSHFAVTLSALAKILDEARQELAELKQRQEQRRKRKPRTLRRRQGRG